MNDEQEGDLLAPVPGARLVNWAFLAAALRRNRKAIVAAALVGAVLGFGLGAFVPKRPTASSTLLLQFPANADPTAAMGTDVALLQTRAVAQAAVRALHLDVTPDAFLSTFHGTGASQRVLRITATGPNAAEATRRASAVTTAFLAFRAQVYKDQLAATVNTLRQQQHDLEIQSQHTHDPVAANGFTGMSQQAESQIENAQAATATVVNGTTVIDPATPAASSEMKTAIRDGVSGLIAGLALGALGVIVLALVSTRARRRADIAATMRAPVALSVGRVIPRGWRRWIARGNLSPDHPNADLQLIARHLQSVLAMAATPALVVVAIDNLRVATLAVQTVARRLTAQGYRVAIVNEGGQAIIDTVPAVDALAERNVETRDDVVLVLAVLDPAKGAEHLREWSADAVAFVTAGRSRAEKLDANAAMIRSASLRLHSIVLIGAESTDDSLGIFDETVPADPFLHTVDMENPENPASARRSLP